MHMYVSRVKCKPAGYLCMYVRTYVCMRACVCVYWIWRQLEATAIPMGWWVVKKAWAYTFQTCMRMCDCLSLQCLFPTMGGTCPYSYYIILWGWPSTSNGCSAQCIQYPSMNLRLVYFESGRLCWVSIVLSCDWNSIVTTLTSYLL